jgi:integrase/recombinase XerD
MNCYIGSTADEMKEGVGVCLLAALAGHSNISTTQRYIDVNADQIKEAVELL